MPHVENRRMLWKTVQACPEESKSRFLVVLTLLTETSGRDHATPQARLQSSQPDTRPGHEADLFHIGHVMTSGQSSMTRDSKSIRPTRRQLNFERQRKAGPLASDIFDTPAHILHGSNLPSATEPTKQATSESPCNYRFCRSICSGKIQRERKNGEERLRGKELGSGLESQDWDLCSTRSPVATVHHRRYRPAATTSDRYVCFGAKRTEPARQIFSVLYPVDEIYSDLADTATWFTTVFTDPRINGVVISPPSGLLSKVQWQLCLSGAAQNRWASRISILDCHELEI
ncbi:hypothetical protein VTL71DRAFT_3995 [Oculimacula yallundae]|uniref:Uncharacterized protein n=1 Tax=Oculimacula yallundae TaxID=86028 RepID=A0ABR4C5B2_9HELO